MLRQNRDSWEAKWKRNGDEKGAFAPLKHGLFWAACGPLNFSIPLIEFHSIFPNIHRLLEPLKLREMLLILH